MSPHILVAHKRSRYEQYLALEDDALQRLLDEDHPSVQSLLSSHERHNASLDQVVRELEELGCDLDVRFRGDIDGVDGVDLVISVGGDGTVLDVSHKITDQPLIGINSDPGKSVGYFCAGTSDETAQLVTRIFDEDWKPMSLMRFAIRLNDERVGYPILNDVLIAHANPAAVTSYLLEVGDQDPEPQKSSGVWISTPAGSTAAIRSAGGYVLPLDSRDFQYLVREPCPPPSKSFRHTKGIRDVDAPFRVISKMREGRVYLDGPHQSVPFRVGDTVALDGDAPPLRIFGLEGKARD
jgi:NAD+ kinase